MDSSPVTAVLNITELIEAIVVHLDAKDLARAQRVCSKFNEVITSSKALKANPFLEPLPSDAYRKWMGFTRAGRYLPLLLFQHDTVTRSINRSSLCKLNPALGSVTAWRLLATSQGSVGATFDTSWLLECSLKCGQTWDQMLLTQPTAGKVQLWYRIRLKSYPVPGSQYYMRDTHRKKRNGFRAPGIREEGNGVVFESWNEGPYQDRLETWGLSSPFDPYPSPESSSPPFYLTNGVPSSYIESQQTSIHSSAGVKLGEVASHLREAIRRAESKSGTTDASIVDGRATSTMRGLVSPERTLIR